MDGPPDERGERERERKDLRSIRVLRRGQVHNTRYLATDRNFFSIKLYASSKPEGNYVGGDLITRGETISDAMHSR